MSEVTLQGEGSSVWVFVMGKPYCVLPEWGRGLPDDPSRPDLDVAIALLKYVVEGLEKRLEEKRR